MKNQKIAVWFSCGAASAVAAKLTLEKYGGNNEIFIVNNPVIEEHEDNFRFLKDVEAWLHHPIEFAKSSKYPKCSAVEVWDDVKFMSNKYGAPCTKELKKVARQEWENSNHPDWHVLGFTVDEIARYERFKLTERDNILPILIEANLSKQDCFNYLISNNIKLPEMYRLGYPNANCIGCVKATSPTYWSHVRNTHPEIYKQRAEQSRRLGVRLVRYKGERMFLDELPEGAKGHAMKAMKVECGIFCEERQ